MPYYVRFKKGVKFDPIAPAAATIIAAIWSAAQTMQRDLLVTCGSESHKPPSRHVLGEAVDLAVGGMYGRQVVTLWRTLCNSLSISASRFWRSTLLSCNRSMSPRNLFNCSWVAASCAWAARPNERKIADRVKNHFMRRQ